MAPARSFAALRMTDEGNTEAIPRPILGGLPAVARHEAAQEDAAEVQGHQRKSHHQHAVRIAAGREHHGHHEDRQHGHPPRGKVAAHVDHADAFQEQHHQRQLETDAEAQRQQEHEAHPLADPRLGVDAQPTVEAEEEQQHALENEEERQAAPARNNSRLKGRKTCTYRRSWG